MSDPVFLNLRGDGNNAAFVCAARIALNQDLPVTANTMSIGEHRIYWLGPDEWLIATTAEQGAESFVRLRKALRNFHSAISDVSGGNTVLRLVGEKARIVLAGGSTLDLDPAVFPLGRCAQTGLAKAAVLIGYVDDSPTYDIIVRRTFADYLARWLATQAPLR